MTTNRDFKQIVRTRMSKTGESYTAARSSVLAGGHQGRPYSVGAVLSIKPRPEIEKPDYASLAGMSDAAIKKNTGCGWEKWVYVLDKVEAHTWPHGRIADYVHEKYKVRAWWTQALTVGYERIKGLRAKGQRRGGGYEASRSKTFGVPVDKLFAAWSNARTRARWLPGVKLKIRTAQPNKTMRITMPDETHVDLWFLAKGAAKSSVSVQHRKLADKADADGRKTYWAERLQALGGLLLPAAKKKKIA